MKIGTRLTVAIWGMLLIAWNALILWESHVNRQTAIEQARSFAQSMHETTLAGLTGMMITGTVGQRDILLDQIRQLSIIRDLNVIRGESVSKAFGPGTANESKPDAIEMQVLATGKEFSDVQTDERGEFLRVVRPALAQKNYLGKDCTQCHQVPENTVLGVVTMKISLNHVNEDVRTQRIESMIAAALLSVPLLAFIWLFIRNFVTIPLEHMVSGLRSIATGESDLTKRLEVSGKDEIGQASMAFNDMMQKLAGLVRHVGDSAAQVSVAAHGVSQSANKVTEGSRQQDGISSAAAEAVEKVVSSIADIAQSTERVHLKSRESERRSVEGNESLARLIGDVAVVEETVMGIADSVNNFVASTATITSITREVKEIADQTNLLALNAAIEAARAGEQGRGFAVVADEVRKLAEKSSASASEIDAITRSLAQQSEAVTSAIGNSVNHIVSSKHSAATVADILSSASTLVADVGTGLDSISGATEEQRRAFSDIASKIEAIASRARENSQSVEQTFAAAGQLAELADALQQAVSRFKT